MSEDNVIRLEKIISSHYVHCPQARDLNARCNCPPVRITVGEAIVPGKDKP